MHLWRRYSEQSWNYWITSHQVKLQSCNQMDKGAQYHLSSMIEKRGIHGWWLISKGIIQLGRSLQYGFLVQGQSISCYYHQDLFPVLGWLLGSHPFFTFVNVNSYTIKCKALIHSYVSNNIIIV